MSLPNGSEPQVRGPAQPVSDVPSGSQSFFRARHMGALIRRFLPLYRTVVALERSVKEALRPLNEQSLPPHAVTTGPG